MKTWQHALNEALWGELEDRLSRSGLDDGQGGYRSPKADEFMLMGFCESWFAGSGDAAKFKHIASRNYLHLDSGGIYVPFTGGAFHLGTFPA